MIEHLRQHNRLNETLFLGFGSLICFVISLFRVAWSDSLMFLFLNWNLFLAFIPWALSTFVSTRRSLQNKRLSLFLLIGTWLVFFPNAPYILTDLFHLQHKFNMPLWFDLVLVLSFAWIGLLFGLFSLWDIERMLIPKWGKVKTAVFSSSFLFLAAFGIYLGRFLRWNSWDIVHHPSGILYDVSDRILNPAQHATTWGVTLFMGFFLNLAYWSFKLIRARQL